LSRARRLPFTAEDAILPGRIGEDVLAMARRPAIRFAASCGLLVYLLYHLTKFRWSSVWMFVLPAIAQALPDSWRNPVTEFWPTQAGGDLTSVHHSARTLQPWPGFGVMCLFVAIVYAIAWTMLDRRDA
jgi:hypothetical protein